MHVAMSLLILRGGRFTAVAFCAISRRNGGSVERWGGACKLSSPRNTKGLAKNAEAWATLIFICLHSSQDSKVLTLSCQVDEQ